MNDDLISRQVAIEMAEHLSDQYYHEADVRIIEGLHKLPSAQPERKKGKWSEAERLKSEVFYCSVCGGRAYHPWVGSRKDERRNVCRYKFCPNCGADMSERKEE